MTAWAHGVAFERGRAGAAPLLFARTLLAAMVVGASVSLAPPAGAGIVFTATTTAESPTLRLVWIANTTVRGWIDGDRGKIEFLESRNEATPRGSLLLTNDGGKTVRLFDPARKTCRPYFANVGAVPRAKLPAGAAATFEKFMVEKTLEEAGPSIAGLPTRHYRFAIRYGTVMPATKDTGRLHTEKTHDIWVTPELTDAAIAIWLSTDVSSIGSEELDRKVSEAIAQVRGAALRRVTVSKTQAEGRPVETLTTTFEVTNLEPEKQIQASTFAEPFPCKVLSPEDRR